MPDLVTFTPVYRVSGIKDVKDFIIFSKELFRLIQKKGCHLEYKNSFNINVRWSLIKNNWVVDMCTNKQRDILGISKDNIDSYYKKDSLTYKAIVLILNAVCNNKDMLVLGQENHLVKNETKMISFRCTFRKDDEENFKIFPLGIFQAKKTKVRKGIETNFREKTFAINNSQMIIEKLSNCLKLVSKSEKLHIKNYQNVHLEFMSFLEEENVKFESVEVKGSDITYDKLQTLEIVYKSKDTFCQSNIDKKNKSKIYNLSLSIFLQKFLLKKLNIDNKESVFIVWEPKKSIYIKISDYYISNMTNEPVEDIEQDLDFDFFKMIPRTL